MTERLHDPTAHAEMIAITAATEAVGGKYLNDCTLYVTVEPCNMCSSALNWAQIGRIVYGALDPKRGYSLYSPSLLHPKTQVQAGVLAEECSALMPTSSKGNVDRRHERVYSRSACRRQMSFHERDSL